MVAETLPQKKDKKHQGFRSTFPLPQKLKIRSLYVIQQLSPAEIGQQVGLTRQQVQNLVHREGWTPIRARAKLALKEKHDARLLEQVSEVQEAFGTKSEELGLRSLDKLSDSLDRRDPNAARDSQAYSQTAKNLYGIVRQARNLDTQQSEGKGGSLVVYIGDLPRVSREEKRAIEVEVRLTPSAPTPTDAPSKPKELPISQGVIEDTGSGVGQQAMD